MSDYISIKDDRFWDILFDEACVEGKQAERIQKELEKIAVDEKEIIRKPMVNVFNRLVAEAVGGVMCQPFITLKKALGIVQEEGGIE